MTTLKKRATVYFDPDIHKALKLKAAETSRSFSGLVDDAIRHELAEDAEDLRAYEERRNEKSISFESFVKKLKTNSEI